MLADDNFAAVVLGVIQTDPATAARKFPYIADAIRDLAPEKPVIFAGLDDGADVPAEYITDLRALGVPYFPSADRAYRALRQLSRRATRDLARAPLPAAAIDTSTGGVILEYRAKQLLAAAGIPFPKGSFAATLANATRIAGEVGYPVVLKAQAAALSHKSDAGGVLLNIADDAALATAWDRLYANVATYDAAITLDGALVEAMGARGVELIIGVRSDPEWGPAILVGFGGVQAELMHDIRLIAHDLTREGIVAELMQLRSAALLTGYRGSPALDIDAVADVIAAIGAVVASTPEIREIDLNPLVVYPVGQGAVALDALIYA